MMYLIVCITTLLASSLTLVSGFGLGTILMPVFAFFFTVETAIAMTAIVHMANNLFKLVVLGRNADRSILINFAFPAIISAFIGAWLLTYFSELPIITSYVIGQREFQVTVVKSTIGILMIGFALVELLPRFEKIKFDKKWLPLGGVISGFFGGLSGHQGAFRSAFLSKAGLDKDTFIATGIAIAVLIDLTRTFVYIRHIITIGKETNWNLIYAAIIAAFIGVLVGSRMVEKMTLRFVQIIVGVMLIFIGFLLGIGLI